MGKHTFSAPIKANQSTQISKQQYLSMFDTHTSHSRNQSVEHESIDTPPNYHHGLEDLSWIEKANITCAEWIERLSFQLETVNLALEVSNQKIQVIITPMLHHERYAVAT